MHPIIVPSRVSCLSGVECGPGAALPPSAWCALAHNDAPCVVLSPTAAPPPAQIIIFILLEHDKAKDKTTLKLKLSENIILFLSNRKKN